MSERAIHLNYLKSSVDRAVYVVDARAVAEALLRRVGDLRPAAAASARRC